MTNVFIAALVFILLLVVGSGLLVCLVWGLKHYRKAYLLGGIIGGVAFSFIWCMIALIVIAANSGEGQYTYPKKVRDDYGSATIEKKVGQPTFMQNLQDGFVESMFEKGWRLALLGFLFGGAIAMFFARTQYYMNAIKKLEAEEQADLEKNKGSGKSKKKSSQDKSKSSPAN